MNKQEKLKKLTWKYFREQKAKEINFFFGIIGLILLSTILIFLAGALVYFIILYVIAPLTTFIGRLILNKDANEVLCSFIGTLILIISILAVYGFTYWLSSNYKKAKARAELELKNKKRVTKK
jgi:ABC-type multidrug transport system fused ATPase/permease subunit